MYIPLLGGRFEKLEFRSEEGWTVLWTLIQSLPPENERRISKQECLGNLEFGDGVSAILEEFEVSFSDAIVLPLSQVAVASQEEDDEEQDFGNLPIEQLTKKQFSIILTIRLQIRLSDEIQLI